MKEYIVKVDTGGNKHWHMNGKWHREDGPAIEYASGSKCWYINGLRHREDGPAVELADGYKEWCINGLRHRIDGPAVEYKDGYKEWWIDDEEITEKEFDKRKQTCHGKIVTIDGKQYKLEEVKGK